MLNEGFVEFLGQMVDELRRRRHMDSNPDLSSWDRNRLQEIEDLLCRVTARSRNKRDKIREQLIHAHDWKGLSEFTGQALAAGRQTTAPIAAPAPGPAAVAESSPELDELWRKAKLLHPSMPIRKEPK